MRLTPESIARMIDLSAVKAQDTEQDVRRMAETALAFGCVAAFVLPSMTPLLVELLGQGSSTAAGGVVGFPSGSDTTRLKAAQARELVEMGCTEIDMVINIGKLLSGRTAEVRDDIRAVVQAVRPLPVKAILECHYLSDEQILAGCDLAVEGGAAFVKTGTGWAATGATLENVTLIKARLGERAGIKAAGGVRGLETLLEMARRGVSRFGLGWRTATEILDRVRSLPGGAVEL
jgi:deoxyribose-phosphate aldolase